MNHPPMKPGMIEAPHRRWAADDLRLESGEAHPRLRAVLRHSRQAQRSAITQCGDDFFTGNHHRLDFLIGPGRALDTERYFIVCVDPIGNGLTSSPSNSVAQSGMRFPASACATWCTRRYRAVHGGVAYRGGAALRGRGLDGRYAGPAMGGEPSRFHALRGRHDADGAYQSLGRGRGGVGAAGPSWPTRRGTARRSPPIRNAVGVPGAG